ncbi:sodium:solute symporter family transporter [Actomonas aquatica]|uniref:Sodium:solute symporter n=1 Tax=Actomonas aquatica TaxID=2866162 RepID=A0ABZ1CEK1_9BACT|nr:hypothetical protein [Opitutus sp. WL0086]WRQ90116.1 hypothetical protein K1X11_011910 [Opitutus sp. WL0086]
MPRLTRFSLLSFIGFTLAPLLQAQSSVATDEVLPALHTGLHWLDWCIIALYLGVVLWLGAKCAKGDSGTAEYFIAAKRHMNPVLIGISTFATILSTVSYLSKPGEMVNKGPTILLALIISAPLTYWVVSRWLIPQLMRLRVTSAYELLEERLGYGVRVLGAVMFILLRLVWMGLLVYLASLALVIIIGLDEKWTPLISALTGIVAVVYTSMGGLRTVVITDLIQFFLLLGGALITIAIVTIKLGGFSWFSLSWNPNWDTQPLFTWDPTVRVSLFGAVLSGMLWQIATAGSDQTAVQRYMATEDKKAASRSYLVSMVALAGVSTVLALLGMSLLAFFTEYPELLQGGLTLSADGDKIFPYFISHFLPIGITGLVVSGAIAAAMSSVDSGVNSITAVVMTDFLDRNGKSFKSEAQHLRFSKFLAAGIGAIVIVTSLFVQYVPGNFTAMTSKTANLLVTPIFCLFILALWVRGATPLSAFLGFAYGFAASVLIAFWEPITGQPQISFQWVGLGALVANLGIALPLAKFGPRREDTRATRNTAIVGLVILAALLFWLL